LLLADSPNVLFIMCDQMKATASHLYGNTFCNTPSLERLAKRGVLFENAITPHPLCVPARISTWTSQWPHGHGGRRNETLMPGDANHAFKIWKNQGYHTGLIGKNHCFKEQSDLDLFDTWCQISHRGLTDGEPTKGMDWVRSVDQINAGHSARRKMPNSSPRFSWAVTDFPLEDYSTGVVGGQTRQFLEDHQEEPFALWVSFPDPHEPWEVPRKYAEMYPRDKIELPPWRADEYTDGTAPERNIALYEMMGIREDSEEDVYGVVGAYYGMIRFMDDEIGKILDTLDETGLSENTVVVFCSDHGDFMGEHAMQCKGGVFYDCLTHVPMIVSWPSKLASDTRDDSPVNLVDLVPTLFQLQGIDIPASMQGRPLPTVTDSPPREATFSEYGSGGPLFKLSDLTKLEKPYGRKGLMRSLQWREAEGRRKMVRTRDWKYVHDSMGDLDELYDLTKDPWELTNIAADPAHSEKIAEMQLLLANWSIETEDSPAIPLPDAEKYEVV
jgi:arylsulfatase